MLTRPRRRSRPCRQGHGRKENETHQWVLDLLGKVEKERELKLGDEEKLVALEKRASLVAAAIGRLHKERDELLQTSKRLHSECGAAHKECD